MVQPMLTNDGAHALVAGVDEAGRGPLAGDVYAAAVILPAKFDLPGLNDSKKLSAKRREKLFVAITGQASAYYVATASVAEIDSINILQASLLAMRRAVDGMAITPQLVLVDGNRLPAWRYNARAIVGGDALEAAIAAASILAKVSRDAAMLTLHTQYPDYGLDRHKGYPTKLHLERLRALGPAPIHRRSFGPVRRLLEETAD